MVYFNDIADLKKLEAVIVAKRTHENKVADQVEDKTDALTGSPTKKLKI